MLPPLIGIVCLRPFQGGLLPRKIPLVVYWRFISCIICCRGFRIQCYCAICSVLSALVSPLVRRKIPFVVYWRFVLLTRDVAGGVRIQCYCAMSCEESALASSFVRRARACKVTAGHCRINSLWQQWRRLPSPLVSSYARHRWWSRRMLTVGVLPPRASVFERRPPGPTSRFPCRFCRRWFRRRTPSP